MNQEQTEWQRLLRERNNGLVVGGQRGCGGGGGGVDVGVLGILANETDSNVRWNSVSRLRWVVPMMFLHLLYR